jgi:hypothetical protein
VTDAELLAGFAPDEYALMQRVLRREDKAAARAREPSWYHKPTDEELIAAGWKSPPPPLPTEAELLQDLHEAHRDIGPRQWVMFWTAAADGVLFALHDRESGLLRHKVTKKWGHMWRLAAPTPAG